MIYHLILHNKYKRYYQHGRCPLAYLVYYMHKYSLLCSTNWLHHANFANYLSHSEINLKIWDGRSVGNVSMNVYAKFHCTPLSIKKALGIFRELIPRTRSRSQSSVLGPAFRVQKFDVDIFWSTVYIIRSAYCCFSAVAVCFTWLYILQHNTDICFRQDRENGNAVS